MTETIYLDNAASTPLDPRVRAQMEPWLGDWCGNPSSRHALGVRGAEAIDAARARVARALACAPERVTFTSGGTEANALGVLGSARSGPGGRILIGPTEHPCVRNSALALEREGFALDTMPVGPRGALDLARVEEQLSADTRLVAIMLANNEFGTVYPVRELAQLVRRRAPEARIHVDAAQAFGKLECSPLELGVDSVAINAHKIHGPLGAGALVLTEDRPLEPLQFGGGQERGLRSGTENVPAIVGLGATAEYAEQDYDATRATCSAARARLAEHLRELGADVLEPGADAAEPLCSVLAAELAGPPAEVQLHHLEAHGVFASAGSACQARSKDISPALRALGLDAERARRVVRFSFGRQTTIAEVDRAAEVLRAVASELGVHTG